MKSVQNDNFNKIIYIYFIGLYNNLLIRNKI